MLILPALESPYLSHFWHQESLPSGNRKVKTPVAMKDLLAHNKLSYWCWYLKFSTALSFITECLGWKGHWGVSTGVDFKISWESDHLMTDESTKTHPGPTHKFWLSERPMGLDQNPHRVLMQLFTGSIFYPLSSNTFFHKRKDQDLLNWLCLSPIF